MTNSEFAQALRGIADFYEQHPEMPQPTLKDLRVYDAGGAANLAAAVRMMADGGTAQKFEDGGDGMLGSIGAARDFGGVSLTVTSYKSSLGKKVRVTREVDAWEIPQSIRELVLDPEAVQA